MYAAFLANRYVFAAALALTGCVAPTGHEYAAALHAATWEDGSAHCADIDTEPTRSECSAAIAEAHHRPASDCAAIQAPIWAEECLFNYAERAATDGDLLGAFDACDGLPTLRPECRGHLLGLATADALRQTPAQIGAGFARYCRARGAPDAEVRFWNAYFAGRSRLGAPPDSAGCPTPACTEAAAQVLDTLRTFRVPAAFPPAVNPDRDP